MRLKLLSLASILFLMAGCIGKKDVAELIKQANASSDVFEGCYSSIFSHEHHADLLITRQGDEYFFIEKKDGRWEENREKMTSVSADEIKQNFPAEADMVHEAIRLKGKASVVEPQFTLLHVKADSALAQKHNTRYIFGRMENGKPISRTLHNTSPTRKLGCD